MSTSDGWITLYRLFAPGIPLIDQPGFMSPGLTLIIPTAKHGTKNTEINIWCVYIYIYYGCCILSSCEGLVMAASTLDIFEWTYRMPNKHHTNHPSYRQCAKCKPFPKESQPMEVVVEPVKFQAILCWIWTKFLKEKQTHVIVYYA